MDMEKIKALLGANFNDDVKTAIQAYADAGGEKFVPKDKYDSLKEERDGYKQQITDRDNQITDLKGKAGNNAELAAQIELLKTQNKSAADDFTKKIHDKSLDAAFKLHTKDMTPAQVKLLNAMVKKDTLKLNEDESDFTNFDDVVTPVKTDFAEVFGVQTGPGAPGNPNNFQNGNSGANGNQQRPQAVSNNLSDGIKDFFESHTKI